jgi:hypothetical protein
MKDWADYIDTPFRFKLEVDESAVEQGTMDQELYEALKNRKITDVNVWLNSHMEGNRITGEVTVFIDEGFIMIPSFEVDSDYWQEFLN